jgi:hypothetical protein
MVEGGLDYEPCRYGTSRILFRGPQKRPDGSSIVVIGGTETYGKFVQAPYPDLLGAALGRTCVNLGCVNAGVDTFAGDEVVQQICAGAALTVIQLGCAQNMSNRFYTVHPRRNDRFVKASNKLRAIYPQVDFAEISFTRHLLETLEAVSPERFELVREELRNAWVARMRRLVGVIGNRCVLLWMGDHRPEDDHAAGSRALYIDRAMLDELSPDVLDVVEVVSPERYAASGTDGMVFPPLQQAAAEVLPGPAHHAAVAEALAGRLGAYL